jgi:uncharacterized protein DUF3943
MLALRRFARRCRASLVAAWAASLAGGAFAADADAPPPATAAGAASAPTTAASAPSTGLGEPRKMPSQPIDYALPALEIIGFDFLLNRFNYHFGSPKEDYAVTIDSIRRNLRSSWDTDRDPFNINQLAHPYQGSIYHGFARSAGFGYWESAAYTFAGSAFWEIFGETTHPSRNDQIASGIGGTFLGEALFRMSNLVLEHGGGLPRVWRELAAAAIAPSASFNRLVFNDRYGAVFSSNGAAYYSRLGFGYARSVHDDTTGPDRIPGNEAQIDFSIDYGLPGAKDYDYRRPFDQFAFQATASSANGFENVLTRGLLVGKAYEAGPSYRGVWGIYGSYDYIAPQTFRVSTTALSLGTTGHWWLARDWSLEGSGLAGVGYTAVGSAHGSTSDRDYNYGVTPQALLALRLTHGDRFALDVTGREYFVSKVASGTSGGHDNIARLDAALTWRLHRQHAVSVRYVGNRRDASFPGGPDLKQVRNTVAIFYTLLGQDRFGGVDWR